MAACCSFETQNLFAQPFDPATLTLSGEPELVADAVWSDDLSVAELVGFDVAAGCSDGGRPRTAYPHDVEENHAGKIPGGGPGLGW
jgi:hypothetical protein